MKKEFYECECGSIAILCGESIINFQNGRYGIYTNFGKVYFVKW